MALMDLRRGVGVKFTTLLQGRPSHPSQ